MAHDQIHQLTVGKFAADAATASAASVGLMSFLGISLSNWALILTCVWFIILIGKWFLLELVPGIIDAFRSKEIEADKLCKKCEAEDEQDTK